MYALYTCVHSIPAGQFQLEMVSLTLLYTEGPSSYNKRKSMALMHAVSHVDL